MPPAPHSDAMPSLKDTLDQQQHDPAPLHYSQAVLVQPEPWASSPSLLLTVTQLQVQSVTKSCDSVCKTKASPFPLCSPGVDSTVFGWVWGQPPPCLHLLLHFTGYTSIQVTPLLGTLRFLQEAHTLLESRALCIFSSCLPIPHDHHSCQHFRLNKGLRFITPPLMVPSCHLG